MTPLQLTPPALSTLLSCSAHAQTTGFGSQPQATELATAVAYGWRHKQCSRMLRQLGVVA